MAASHEPGASTAETYFDSSEFELRAEFEDTHYWHLHRREVLLEALEQVCPNRGAKLIEVGCGIGTVATHLNASGYHVDYADVHQTGLDIARKRARRRLGERAERSSFGQLDVLAGPIPEEYTGILLFDVLEHLPNAPGALENLRASLGGPHSERFVLLSVPAFQFLWSPWDDIEKHKCRYTKTSLGEVASAAGFEVERATYFFAPLFFAALGVKGLRLAKARLSPPKQAQTIVDLTEAKNIALLNRLALRILKPERAWLRERSLPFGTSLLAVLRPRA